MKEHAISAAMKTDNPVQRLNLLREYVQAFILRSFHESEAAKSIAFVGGTALRFLENLPRFSEDLDFSLLSSESYEPVKWLDKLKRDLSLSGFESNIKWNDRKTVQTAWVRIPSILSESGLSGLPGQNLSIKIKVDTRPPAGADIRRTVITRHLTFVVSHYSIKSLMAGKIHALLTRPYCKGRDWYDLVWYRSHRPPLEPNIPMLQNALNQTQGIGTMNAENWRKIIRSKLDNLDNNILIEDVRAFLEHPDDARLLTRENLLLVLE